MRQFLSSPDLFALVTLLRSGTSQALLLVEGSTDSLCLTPHIDASDTRIVVGYGRNSVEEAVQKSDSHKVPHVVGLVDADLDDYLNPGRAVRSASIVRTTNYDLEADVLSIPGLVDRLVFSQAEKDLVDSFMASNSDGSVLEMAARLAYNVGKLRLDSGRNRYGLYLRELPLDQFLDASAPHLDHDRLAAIIVAKSRTSSLTKMQIIRALKSITRDPVDFKLCCGHDLLRVLKGALSSWWRTKMTYESIGRVLRAMVARSDLMSMQIYIDLDEWAKRNGRSIWAS
jgi:hypothetical protein